VKPTIIAWSEQLYSTLIINNVSKLRESSLITLLHIWLERGSILRPKFMRRQAQVYYSIKKIPISLTSTNGRYNKLCEPLNMASLRETNLEWEIQKMTIISTWLYMRSYQSIFGRLADWWRRLSLVPKAKEIYQPHCGWGADKTGNGSWAYFSFANLLCKYSPYFRLKCLKKRL